MKHPTQWAILILLLAACGLNQPTVTSSPIPDTATASRVPMRTDAPTKTPLTVSPSPTQTPKPTITPWPTIDFENLSFEVNYSLEYPVENLLSSGSVLVSPNEEILVDFYPDLTIMNMNGNVFLEIPLSVGYQLFNGYYWSEVQWSPDSRYLYFSMVRVHPCYFCDGTGFWKLDVVTGKYIEVLPVQTQREANLVESIELSPSQTKLAYISLWEEPLSLYVIDIENRITQEFLINSELKLAGEIVWSLDESKLIYIGSEDRAIIYNEENTISFYLLDLDSGEHQFLFETIEVYYYVYTWEKDNIVEFHDGCEIDVFDIDLERFIVNSIATPRPPEYYFYHSCLDTPTPTP